MRTAYIMLFLLFRTFFIAQGQTIETCWGHVADSPARLDLVVGSGMEVSGNMQFLDFPKRIPFKGRVTKDQSFIFYKKVGEEDKVVFQGKREGGYWRGIWVDEGQVRHFLFRSETYFNGIGRFFQEGILENGLTRQLVQLDSLFTRYWSRDKEAEQAEINRLGDTLIDLMKRYLEDEAVVDYNWEQLLGLNEVETPERALKLVSWSSNQFGSARKQINLIQYRAVNGELKAGMLENGWSYSDIYTLYEGDEPFFLLKGTLQTCPDCRMDIMELLHVGSSGLESDYGGFQFTDRDPSSGEERKNYQSSFSIQYRNGDLIDLSFDPEMMELHYAYIQRVGDLYKGDLSPAQGAAGETDILIEGTLRAHGSTFKEVLRRERILSEAESIYIRQ